MLCMVILFSTRITIQSMTMLYPFEPHQLGNRHVSSICSLCSPYNKTVSPDKGYNERDSIP
jgi:hypothetical protein